MDETQKTIESVFQCTVTLYLSILTLVSLFEPNKRIVPRNPCSEKNLMLTIIGLGVGKTGQTIAQGFYYAPSTKLSVRSAVIYSTPTEDIVAFSGG